MIPRIQKALAARRDVLMPGDTGFTLVELLVVVIIIGILAAIAIPVYIGAQNNAKDSAVQSDLSNIKTAVVAYTTNNSSVSSAPPLNASTLSSYGFSKSGTYTAAPAYAAAPTSTAALFCITATSITNRQFWVSTNTGVTSGSCPASNGTW